MYSSAFTGIGRYVFELTKNLFQIDQKNEYVLFFNEPEYSAFTSPNGRVTKVLVNARHYSFSEQTKFLKLLNQQHLDLMHFTHFNAPFFYRRPSIVTIHDLTLSFYPGKKMTSPLHRLAYHLIINSAVRKAKKIIAVSKNTKKDIEKILKIPAKKIEVIYEGINDDIKKPLTPDQIADTKQKYKIDRPFLLYTGVWRSHKNLPNLLKAFRILVNEYDFDGYLVITGRKDPLYEEEIITQTQSLQIENNVIFPGLVSEQELAALYKSAAVYIFPSFYEGFGLPPLEAMACGTPVATSDRSCMPEICGADPVGPTALYFDPDKPEEIASQTFRILSEKSLRETLIANSLKHIQQFSWPKMAAATLTLYSPSDGE
jgi:glycosyltransferase involved in cell wall biosynthesis